MKILVLALGNDLMGDDIAGFIVADELMKKLSRDVVKYVDIVKTIESGIKLIDYFTMGYEYIFIIDSLMGENIGDVNRIIIKEDISYTAPSFHWMGVPELLSLIREFNYPLPHIEIYGIVIGNIKMGYEPDERVLNAALKLSYFLKERIERILGRLI